MRANDCSNANCRPPCIKRATRKSVWQSSFWCTVLSVLAGLLVIALFLAGFSLLIGNTDVSEELVQAMACIALCAGSFTAGFVAAKKRRQKGLLVGLLCGIVMYFVVLIIGLFLLQSASAAGTAAKLIVMILCSCIGGVVGVNTRCKKPECQ